MANVSQTFKKIQNLRERYFKASKNKDALLKMISEAEIPEHVYNSNAIENSTLTLEETEKILLQIDVDRFISEREIFEAKNLARVVEYIDLKSKDKELTFEGILLLHKMLLSNIQNDIAGRFRRDSEMVRVGSHIAPSPKDLPALLEEMFVEYNISSNQHIVKRISKFHLLFENAHPFIDGNGRIGRVLMNYLLIREGFVPINIKFIDRSRYYDAFKEFEKSKNTEIMEELVGRALSNSYHKRLSYLEDKKIIVLSDYAKQSKQSPQNIFNKAKRQTIEAFLEKGVWKIGIKSK
jgi:Fic family protein